MADEERVESLFFRALALEGEERDAFLRRACGDDRELRLQVKALLESAGGSDEAPTMPHQYQAEPAAGTGAGPEEAPGAVIGQYRLLQKLGEGGFGTVWMAQQQAPIKRRVALKIIKLGMDTQQVIARFDAERQALAVLDHPNIAKVYDAGSSAAGRPYFVMELVKGVSILEYCDSARLDTRSRLDLFIKVCHALQHAHHKGIIHRDIKPSNILVTLQEGGPEPKIIDFGIAKATNAELTQQTFFTEFRQLIGTPAYMSPEQADQRGLDIDTRSDIYSLGVLLYELLTGATPFDMEAIMQGGYAEMLRLLRESEPPKPSARVSTLGESAAGAAAARRTEVRQLSALLRRDLGEDHETTLIALNNLGGLLLDLGRLAEAEPYCREALEARVRVLGGEHPETLASIATMGRFLLEVGRYSEAVALLAEHERASRLVFSEGNAPRLASLLVSLGRARVGLGGVDSLASAEESLLEAHSIFSEAWGEGHESAQDAALALVELYTARHAAEPTSGHELRAGSWRSRAEAAANGPRRP